MARRSLGYVAAAALTPWLKRGACAPRLVSEFDPGARSAPRQPLYDRVEALRVHRLDAEAELAPFGASSKLDTRGSFLRQLRGIGRRAADEWLRHARLTPLNRRAHRRQ